MEKNISCMFHDVSHVFTREDIQCDNDSLQNPSAYSLKYKMHRKKKNVSNNGCKFRKISTYKSSILNTLQNSSTAGVECGL